MIAIIAAHAAEPAELVLPLAELLRRGAAAVSGSATLANCHGSRSTNNEIGASVASAERALSYLDFPAARQALAEARGLLLCAREPIAAGVAARIPFLEGMVAHLSGEGDARAAFREALVLRPPLPWDPSFPPESMLAFDAARGDVEALAGVALHVTPAPPADALWIDGAAWPAGPILLRPGSHLLQFADDGWRTLRIDLAGESELLVPAWFPSDLDGWLDDPARGRTISTMLARDFAPGTRVRAQAGGSIWSGTVGEAQWEAVVLPPPPRRRIAPLAVLVTGIVGFAAGAAMTGAGWIGSADAADDAAAASDWQDYVSARGRYDAYSSVLAAGGWTLAAGAVVSAVGVPLVVAEERRFRAEGAR